MSGATGAGPAKTGANGARGPAADSESGDTPAEGMGGTVTDTRGPQSEPQAKPQSASKQKQKPAADKDKDAAGQPYHPPQAYAAPKKPGAQRGPVPGTRTTPRTRKARLRVAKADPWSVMKVSFLLSIALGVCTVVAAAVLWMVMDAMGIFSTVGGTISEATGSNEGNGFDLQSFLSLPRVLIFTSVIAVIDVVLMTALATLGAFIYNLSAGFVGGVELTLAEDE
ncbi:transmembrane protein DUF3566 [Streptomyces sp. 3211.6]|uniref:DUF3566 domain-containing protein n=1 Tax=Streptomyces sp. 3211.6 TaxID=1938845 RepID=UPI000C2C976F|nr:DUF3566 domain-containing protein [Streptomyces sp. 3211.6]RKT05694.1 transmembrane protein DUF3566 [Streptomyces sp. 3211.6]